MIGHERVWKQVAQECPRRIISTLHRCGQYIHGTSSRFPGKILCFHREGSLPADWTPTAAQQEAWQAGQEQTAALGDSGSTGPQEVA